MHIMGFGNNDQPIKMPGSIGFGDNVKTEKLPAEIGPNSDNKVDKLNSATGVENGNSNIGAHSNLNSKIDMSQFTNENDIQEIDASQFIDDFN